MAVSISTLSEVSILLSIRMNLNIYHERTMTIIIIIMDTIILNVFFIDRYFLFLKTVHKFQAIITKRI